MDNMLILCPPHPSTLYKRNKRNQNRRKVSSNFDRSIYLPIFSFFECPYFPQAKPLPFLPAPGTVPCAYKIASVPKREYEYEVLLSVLYSSLSASKPRDQPPFKPLLGKNSPQTDEVISQIPSSIFIHIVKLVSLLRLHPRLHSPLGLLSSITLTSSCCTRRFFRPNALVLTTPLS